MSEDGDEGEIQFSIEDCEREMYGLGDLVDDNSLYTVRRVADNVDLNI